VDPARLDESDGTEETLRRRQTKYHQSCRISLTNMKLEGHRKEFLVLLQVRVATIGENEDPASKMRQAMAMQINTRQYCPKLNDGAYFVVVTQQLKYHPVCLTCLYNRERASVSTLENEKTEQTSQELYTWDCLRPGRNPPRA